MSVNLLLLVSVPFVMSHKGTNSSSLFMTQSQVVDLFLSPSKVVEGPTKHCKAELYGPFWIINYQGRDEK